MLENIYAFGHKNPDTDSVCAAISLAYLKNIKKGHVTPYILGTINNETKYVLNYFKVGKPLYLNDVKLQVSDLNYRKNCFLKENNTLNDLYNFMQKEEVTGVPIARNNNEYLGIITMKDLLKIIIDPHYDSLVTSYNNILEVINGKELLRFRENINGRLLLSAYKTTDFEENIKLERNNILIIGNRFNIIQKAIEERVQLIIIVGTTKIGEDIIKHAKRNNVSIIVTKEESLFVSRMLVLANYIKNMDVGGRINPINEKMFVNDFLTLANKYHFTNYPVVDRKNRVLGLLRMEDVNFQNKKKVILLDHNEYSQSADGIEEAEIIEIIDHHKVGNINSSSPINIRNMAVGSTNTILYQMYKEQKVIPPKNIAGLMLSGIISDTLMLHSPTATEYDVKAVNELAKIAGVDPVKYSKGMFLAAASIKGKTIEELIYNDFKAFNISNRKIGVGQMTVINYEKVLKDKQKYLDVIEKIAHDHDYDIFAFCITDVINSNTYLLYNEKAKTVFETIFDANPIYEGYKLNGVVSRKKQIIPLLMEELR
jgi:manganese-dependent inorganic pyrophosphatase